MNTRMMFAQRMIGTASGIFVTVLFAVPLVVVIYLLLGVDFSSNWRIIIPFVISIVLFGFGVFVGIRNAVRRWREIAEVQGIIGAMTEDERKEFYDNIEHSDVELCTDESGKNHSLPLDH